MRILLSTIIFIIASSALLALEENEIYISSKLSYIEVDTVEVQILLSNKANRQISFHVDFEDIKFLNCGNLEGHIESDGQKTLSHSTGILPPNGWGNRTALFKIKDFNNDCKIELSVKLFESASTSDRENLREYVSKIFSVNKNQFSIEHHNVPINQEAIFSEIIVEKIMGHVNVNGHFVRVYLQSSFLDRRLFEINNEEITCFYQDESNNKTQILSNINLVNINNSRVYLEESEWHVFILNIPYIEDEINCQGNIIIKSESTDGDLIEVEKIKLDLQQMLLGKYITIGRI